MFSFFKKIRAVRNWLKAMDYAAIQNYEAAYLCLNMAKKEGLNNLEVILFNIFLAVSTNRYIEANDRLEDFFQRIFNAKKYNNDEKNYLAAYASWCCNSLPEDASSKQYMKSIYFRKYSLKNVSNSIKRNFPLQEFK